VPIPSRGVPFFIESRPNLATGARVGRKTKLSAQNGRERDNPFDCICSFASQRKLIMKCCCLSFLMPLTLYGVSKALDSILKSISYVRTYF
jgi:hypothetical protein